jgi:gliding motility-associated-like protein
MTAIGMKNTLFKHLGFLVLGCLMHLASWAQVSFQSNNIEGCTPLGVIISVSTPTSGISSYLWQITQPNGTVVTATTAQYVAILSQPGAYDVTLTINGNQTQTINDYINVYALPVAQISADDAIGCYPLCVNFNDATISGGGDIVTWSWDFGDGGTSNQQNPSYCYDQVGTFSPVLSIVDEFGCISNATAGGLVQVDDDFPSAQFTASSILDCNPPIQITMTNTSSGSSALSSEWSFGDGQTQTISGIGPVTHSYTQLGNLDVCLTVTDDIGCEHETCEEIFLFQNPNASFTVSENATCEGVVLSFESTTTPIPPSITWDFDGDGIVDANGASPQFAYDQEGTYQPTITVTYSNQCTQTTSANQTITVADGIQPGFTANVTSACVPPLNVSFTNTTVGAGTNTFEWLIDGVLAGTGSNLVHTFSDYGVFDVTLIATNSAGCSYEVAMNNYITIQAPTISFNNESTVCTDEIVAITNVNISTVDPILHYYWDFNEDGVFDADAIAPQYSYDVTGSYHITLQIETVSGCVASYTPAQAVQVLTNVDASFTASFTESCAGQPIEFCITPQAGNIYSWNFYDGSGWISMDLNEECILHDYADTGYFDLAITVFNGACAVNEVFEDYIHILPPVAVWDYSLNCNNPLLVNFFSTSIEADSLVWDFGDGSPLVINEVNPVHQYSAIGEYLVNLTVYNTSNPAWTCPDSQSDVISVSSPSTLLEFTNNVGCPPLYLNIDEDSFNAIWEVEFSNGYSIVNTYQEISNTYQTIQYFNGEYLATINFLANNPNHWPYVVFEDAGTYDATVTVTDANGCQATEVYEDIVNVTANPDFAAFDVSLFGDCSPFQVQLTPQLQNLVSWQWIFPNGGIGNTENPVYTILPPYNYNTPSSVTLTATDAQGCTSTVTQPIDILPPATIDFFAANDPGCIGALTDFINNTQGPEGTTYTWDFGDATSSNNQSTEFQPQHIYNANGTYEVCLTADNGYGCAVTECVNDAVHIINPEVSFNFTTGTSNCLYGVTLVNTTPGEIVQSAWEFGDNQQGFGVQVFHTYPIGVYDVQLTVINEYGCVDSLLVEDILNFGNQVGPFTAVLDSANCAPFDVELSAWNINDQTFDYFWDFNDGNGDPIGGTVTDHTYLQPGSYCPSLIMTDPNGCSVFISCSDTIVVDEFVIGYQTPEYICEGESYTIDISGVELVSWVNNPYLSNGNNDLQFVLSPPVDTDFYITGIYADCERTDTIHVVVSPLPSVTLDMDTTICYQDAIFPLTDGWPAFPVGSYTINNAPATSFDPSWTPGLDYTIGYTYVDSLGCANSTQTIVHIYELPIVQYEPIDAQCQNTGDVMFQTANPTGGVYFLADTIIQQFSSATPEGTYDFNYTYTDIHGCSQDAQQSLTIYPSPIVDIAVPDFCMDDLIYFENNSYVNLGNIASVEWMINGNTFNVFQPEGLVFNEYGQFPLHVTLLNDIGCTAELDTNFNVYPVPHSLFTAAWSCQGDSVQFQDLSTIESDTITQWTWNMEGADYMDDSTFSYAFTGWGNIPVSLTTWTQHGCDHTYTTPVTVHPLPVVELIFDHVCDGQEVQFIANESIPSGGIVSQHWDFGDGVNSENDNFADHLYTTPAQYTVTYTAISNIGCTVVISDTVQVYPMPTAQFDADPHQVCQGESAYLIDQSSINYPDQLDQWEWHIGDSLVSTQQFATVVYQTPGNYDVSLQVTSNHGCTNALTQQNFLTVYPKPSANFSCESELYMYDPVVHIQDLSSQDASQWYYYFDDGGQANTENCVHEYLEVGTYNIFQFVENTWGCKDTSFQIVTIRPDMMIYIPNAFTPDQNGHNEVFKPVTYGFEIVEYQFTIFNRWGDVMFTTTDPEQGWDGWYENTLSQDGLYNWQLDIRNEYDITLHRKTGNVFLVR